MAARRKTPVGRRLDGAHSPLDNSSNAPLTQAPSKPTGTTHAASVQSAVARHSADPNATPCPGMHSPHSCPVRVAEQASVPKHSKSEEAADRELQPRQ